MIEGHNDIILELTACGRELICVKVKRKSPPGHLPAKLAETIIPKGQLLEAIRNLKESEG